VLATATDALAQNCHHAILVDKIFYVRQKVQGLKILFVYDASKKLCVANSNGKQRKRRMQ
jgi:hypothetical protein